MTMIHIEQFLLKPYRFPLARPFVVGGQALSIREGLIVEIVGRDGNRGLGEAAPLPGVSTEELKKAAHQLKCLEREWVGRTLPVSCEALCARLQKDLDRSVLAPSVIFALESALVSLAAGMQGVSVAEFLGDGPPKVVRSACLIQGDLEVVRAYGAKYSADGFSIFKLKVGNRNIPLDVLKVRALKEMIGFDDRIRLDANAAWSLEEAVAFACAIGKEQIDFIEEPCSGQNDHEKFFRRTDMPWAVEAHSSVRPLSDWEGIQGLKAVVIKPMLSGGINGFLSVKDIAYRLGAQVVVSSLFETSVGFRMLANCAALTDTCCGLGTADWFGSPAAGIMQKGGLIPPVNLIA